MSNEITHFKEKEQVLQALNELIHLEEPQGTPDDVYQAKLCKLVGQLGDWLNVYQEQPQLLDPHLQDMVNPVMEDVQRIIQQREKLQQDTTQSFPFQLYKNPKLNHYFKYIYLLCKIRGYKTIVKLFPHEARDLEPTLRLIKSQDQDNYALWETRYVLLLWLSILCLIPFDLTTIDSSLAISDGENDRVDKEGSLIYSITTLCKNYLSDPGPAKEAAAVCLARLLSRPDMQAVHIQKFLQWATSVLDEYLSNTIDNMFLITGVLLTLAQICKFAHRENYVDLTSLYFDRVIKLAITQNTLDSSVPRQTLQRKLIVKLVQRTGLLFLPPRIMPWRYNRGKRYLALNTAGDIPSQEEEKYDESEEAQADIPQEMEDVIDVLLCGLRDKDTIVRWSSAKGIGRTTGRLPYEFADDIVQSVLELFAESEGDAAWHGAALAMAELARRGLLLPNRLPVAVDAVLKALKYDIRRGSTSVGAHVRDAACYMCWAFARAYAPSIMAPYVVELSRGMLSTAVFDREINCRRAASAAFQENVGRQGHANFKHGIEILTAADYFTLGNRVNAYTKISCQIAKFSLYRYALIDTCVESKIFHWDESIRVLASKALYNLTKLDPAYMMNEILPNLIEKTLSSEVYQRHGATLAVAEIVLAIAEVPCLIDGENWKRVRNLVPRIEKARLYRGRGGEIMRGAVCRLIECMAKTGLNLSERMIFRLMDTIDECLKHPNRDIQMSSLGAYRALSHDHFAMLNHDPKVAKKLKTRTIEKYLKEVDTNKNVAYRRGYVRALGASPKFLLSSCHKTLQTVVDTMSKATTLEDNPEDRDAEARKEAILGLIEMSEQVGVQGSEGFSASMISIVFNALLNSLKDYSTDDRGDVGSWVRKEGMLALARFMKMLVKAEPGESEDPSETSDTDRSMYTVNDRVSIRGYGLGTVTKVFGEERPSCEVQFEQGSMGFVHFQPTGVGIFACGNPSMEKLDAFSGRNGAEEEFMIPSLEKRREYLIETSNMAVPLSSPTRRRVSAEMVEELFCALVKQLSEKLDVIRDVAGNVLFRLLHSTQPVIPFIPDRPQLTAILPRSLDINWASATDVFPLLLKLIDIPEYMSSIAAGLVVSVGGLTESVVTSSRNALLSWMDGHYKSKNYGILSRFAFELLRLFQEHEHDDRVVIPLMKTVSSISQRDLFSFLHEDGPAFGMQLYECICKELKNCSNIPKIVASVGVLIGLLPSDPAVVQRTLKGLLVLLGHRFPKARKVVAEQLYTRLLIHDDLIDEEKYDDVLVILSETSWNADLKTVRAERDKLYTLLNISHTRAIETATVVPIPSAAAKDTEKDSYQSLVKEMGY